VIILDKGMCHKDDLGSFHCPQFPWKTNPFGFLKMKRRLLKSDKVFTKCQHPSLEGFPAVNFYIVMFIVWYKGHVWYLSIWRHQTTSIAM